MKAWLYRAFTLIALLIVGASIWYVKSNPHDYKECAKAAQIAAYDDLMLDAGIEAITPARQAQYKQAIIDNQIKCSDLGAQWGMTDIALLGYVAGLLGLFFLGITVFETQSAATAARETLKLTDIAIGVTRDIGQKQVKAYLTATKATWHTDYMMGILEVEIKNLGQSPVISGKATGEMKAILIGAIEGDSGALEVFSNKNGSVSAIDKELGSLGSGESTTFVLVFLRNELNDVVLEKYLFTDKVNCHFKACIEWTDVFNTVSSIKVAFRKDGDTEIDDYSRHYETTKTNYKAVTLSAII